MNLTDDATFPLELTKNTKTRINQQIDVTHYKKEHICTIEINNGCSGSSSIKTGNQDRDMAN